MSILTVPHLLPALPPEPVLRLSVEQYHAMIDAGKLTADDAVELLEGWLVPKMPKNPPHRYSTRATRVAIEQVIVSGWYVDSQEAVTTADSEPEPDVSVVRGTARDYVARHPGPENIGMVVEVADSSLARDRGIKKRAYARARIPIYWIVNLQGRCIEVYTDPTGPAEQPDYGEPRVHGENESVPVVLDGIEIGRIEVKDVLP